MKKYFQWIVMIAVLGGVLLTGWSVNSTDSPARQASFMNVAPGISYRRQLLDQPRPIVIHLARIDLRTPGLQVVVSPGIPGLPDGMEILAMTTSQFAQRHHTQLAINASYFYPFREDRVRGYPRTGDPVNVVGQAISSGVVYSGPVSDDASWRMLCIDEHHRAHIVEAQACEKGAQHAVAGNELLIKNGTPTAADGPPDSRKPYPRTVVGTTRDGDILWLVTVDGKQPGYSEGMSLRELALFLAPLGLEMALNLDGGGSTTMVADGPMGPRALNSPAHQSTPGLERPVANHLGFRVP